jgi:hypothetical protein
VTDLDLLIALKKLLENDIAQFKKTLERHDTLPRLPLANIRGQEAEADRILTWLYEHKREVFE